MSAVAERPARPDPGRVSRPGSGSGGGPGSGKNTGKRPRSPLWTKLVTALGAVLALVAAGGIVSAKYFLGQLTDNIQTTSSVLGGSSTGSNSSGGTPAGKLPDGAMNLLLLGLDTREGWDAAGKSSRSDTIIIMHIAASHDSAQMISIPRDMLATIPADPSIGYRGSVDKINSAYEVGSQNGRGWQGGAKEATAAVHQLTGVSFNGVVVIDFDGFKGMLEAMGGVYLCVDKDMWSSHYTVDSKGRVSYAKGANPDNPPSNALWFRKGCRNMAPWEALEFSRLRHSSNGDYDRQRHQQQLLKAMAKKASSSGVLTNPSKVSKVLAAAGKSLKMDTHGVSITDFMFGLKGLASADLVPVKTNNGTYASVDNGKAEGVAPVTRDLFAATAADRLNSFLLDHPGLVIDGAAPAK
jgi:LCP family protein required for cell wall assembly